MVLEHAPPPLLVKVLTMSDTTFTVAKSGRLVLPRAQVERCLSDLLRLGGAPDAADAARASASLRMSSDLRLYDASGREWPVTLKTWQNAVSGHAKPTYVLESTAEFIRANGAAQGDALAFGADASGTRLIAHLTKSSTIAAQGSPFAALAVQEVSKLDKKRPSSRQSSVAPKTPAVSRSTSSGGVRKHRAARKSPPRLPLPAEDVTAASILLDMLSSSSSGSVSGNGSDGSGTTAAAAASHLLSAPSMGSISMHPVSLIPLPHLMSQLWSAATPLRSSLLLPPAPPLVTLPSAAQAPTSWAAGLSMLKVGSMPPLVSASVGAATVPSQTQR